MLVVYMEGVPKPNIVSDCMKAKCPRISKS